MVRISDHQVHFIFSKILPLMSPNIDPSHSNRGQSLKIVKRTIQLKILKKMTFHRHSIHHRQLPLSNHHHNYYC